MSLVNVFLDADHAFVAVDTAALMQNGLGHTSKLTALFHSGLLIASRGDIRLLREAEYRFAGSGFDFDAALADAPAAFLDITGKMVKVDPRLWGAGTAHELLLVGWSDDRQRMAGHYFVVDGGTGSFKEQEIDDCEPFPAPCEPFEGRRLTPTTDTQEMIAIARMQVRWCRENHPSETIGGRLLVATVSRHEINVRDVADLEQSN